VGKPQKNGTKNKKNSSPSAFVGTRGRGPSPSSGTVTLGEEAPSPSAGAWHSGKRSPSPSARAWHSGKTFFKFLANGPVQCCRQMQISFCECPSSPSVVLGEDSFPECHPSPSAMGFATLRKTPLPRVYFFPECNTRGRLASPSARFLALGEEFDTRGISILP
jgi:hypothetical protein